MNGTAESLLQCASVGHTFYDEGDDGDEMRRARRAAAEPMALHGTACRSDRAAYRRDRTQTANKQAGYVLELDVGISDSPAGRKSAGDEAVLECRMT